MGVVTGQAVEELVAHGNADDIGAGIQELLDGNRRLGLGLDPVIIVGVAVRNLAPGDMVEVLDRKGLAGERAISRSKNRLGDVVGHERARPVFGNLHIGHARLALLLGAGFLFPGFRQGLCLVEPVEDLLAVPAHHARVGEDMLEGLAHIFDPVR